MRGVVNGLACKLNVVGENGRYAEDAANSRPVAFKNALIVLATVAIRFVPNVDSSPVERERLYRRPKEKLMALDLRQEIYRRNREPHIYRMRRTALGKFVHASSQSAKSLSPFSLSQTSQQDEGGMA